MERKNRMTYKEEVETKIALYKNDLKEILAAKDTVECENKTKELIKNIVILNKNIQIENIENILEYKEELFTIKSQAMNILLYRKSKKDNLN